MHEARWRRLMVVATTAMLGVLVFTTAGSAQDPSPLPSPSASAAFAPSAAPATPPDIPTALEAVACDEPRALIAVDDPWDEAGAFDYPLAALDAALAQVELTPRSGFSILALDASGTHALFGYLVDDRVKAAARVAAVDAPAGGWVPDGLAVCHVSELGDAPMASGIRLWTNRSGRAIHETRGTEACGPALRLLYLTRPRGDGTFRTRAFARDPEGDLRRAWRSTYQRDTHLPAEARFSGYRRDGARLFLDPTGDAVYLKRGRSVERWPRVPLANGCGSAREAPQEETVPSVKES